MGTPFRLTALDDYKPLLRADALDRIRDKARPLRDLHVVHINSTYYGGGVAQILSSLALLMNSVGLKAGWRVLQGRPDFFSITKKFHNALQGGRVDLTNLKTQIYEEVVYENAVRNHLDHDFVVVHDPQPLPLIEHYHRRCPWVWRCHVDLTQPQPEVWNYLRPFMEQYDAAIFSLPEYAQPLATPAVFFAPAINPFSSTNREFSAAEIDERLAHYHIPTDLPLVVQVSRFDRWKDPAGVIEAFELARRETPATLVLLGNVATDDPEGTQVYEALLAKRHERVRILSCQDSALVNALQRRAAVVVQKSLREGFGLTVTEAMWKKAAVIGGNVGGIRHQIKNGVNGFLVSSVSEAAERMVQLLQDADLRHTMGNLAHESVRQNFLLPRLLEQYLDLFSSFDTIFRLQKSPPGAHKL